jgi:hypothetical protein
MSNLTRRRAIGAIGAACVAPAIAASVVAAPTWNEDWVRIPLGRPRTSDHAGKLVRVGNRVRLLCLTEVGVDELPPADRNDALAMVGGTYVISDIDDDGRPWIEHSWVDADQMERTLALALDPHEFACAGWEHQRFSTWEERRAIAR